MLLLLLVVTMTPVQLKALREHRDAEEKKAGLLAREGKYGDALAVLTALDKELETKLKDVPKKDQDAAYLGTSRAVLKTKLDELGAWVRWAAKANTDASAAMDLLLGLLHPKTISFDGARTTVRDPVAQKLIASLRKLAPDAKLLGARKVKVVVKGKDLDKAELAHFGKELAATLKALGHDAAVEAGAEPFEVELVGKGPVSAHLIGDDVDECALIAVAKWPAGGLARLDLTAHGFGDEETPGNCYESRVKEVVALAAEQILRKAMRMSPAQNLNKAEGPNGVFD